MDRSGASAAGGGMPGRRKDQIAVLDDREVEAAQFGGQRLAALWREGGSGGVLHARLKAEGTEGVARWTAARASGSRKALPHLHRALWVQR
ncbi:hypothetical protein KNE206_43220 [Kitasatospora sp. NE20-6]